VIEIGKDILIPVFIALISIFVPEMVLRFLNNNEKNQYIGVLKIRSPFIETFLSKKEEYKKKTLTIIFVCLLFGLIIGAYVEKYVMESIYLFFLKYISELDFIKGRFSFINNHNDFNSILLLDSFSSISILT